MKLKEYHIIFSSFVLISNIYFLPQTFKVIIEDGGPMGFGYLFLPFTLLINFGIITSLIVILKKLYANRFLLVFNSSVIFLILFFLYLSI